MSHAGSSSNDDCCGSPRSDRDVSGSGSTACEPDVVYSRELLKSDFENNRLPVQVARDDAAQFRSASPFVLHAGQMLFVVTEDRDAWVVAEMRFDAEACLFTEARVSRFTWPREAFGRLMSRAVVGESIDEDSADRVTRGFSGWLAAQFVA